MQKRGRAAGDCLEAGAMKGSERKGTIEVWVELQGAMEGCVEMERAI